MKVDCDCGKACVTYQSIGEDEFEAIAINTKVKTNYEGGKVCVCLSCGDSYDTFDPYMVKLVTDENGIEL